MVGLRLPEAGADCRPGVGLVQTFLEPFVGGCRVTDVITPLWDVPQDTARRHHDRANRPKTGRFSARVLSQKGPSIRAIGGIEGPFWGYPVRFAGLRYRFGRIFARLPTSAVPAGVCRDYLHGLLDQSQDERHAVDLATVAAQCANNLENQYSHCVTDVDDHAQDEHDDADWREHNRE